MDQDWIIVERKPGNVLTFLIKQQANAQAYNDLTSKLPEEAAPGSTAYTATLSYMANKDLDGGWKQIGA